MYQYSCICVEREVWRTKTRKKCWTTAIWRYVREQNAGTVRAWNATYDQYPGLIDTSKMFQWKKNKPSNRYQFCRARSAWLLWSSTSIHLLCASVCVYYMHFMYLHSKFSVSVGKEVLKRFHLYAFFWLLANNYPIMTKLMCARCVCIRRCRLHSNHRTIARWCVCYACAMFGNGYIAFCSRAL